jgi:hypothetical protein
MTIHSVKLGPGTLTLGSGTPLECSSQLTSCKVNPSESVTSTDAIKVLSGEQLAGSSSASFSFTLEGTFLQDLGYAGVVAYSWTNAGELVPFTFTPNTAAGAVVTGNLYPVPLAVGGDDPDGAPLASDFTWRIDGTPTYTD